MKIEIPAEVRGDFRSSIESVLAGLITECQELEQKMSIINSKIDYFRSVVKQLDEEAPYNSDPTVSFESKDQNKNIRYYGEKVALDEDSQYPFRGSWNNKILFITEHALQYDSEPLTVSAIINAIYREEPAEEGKVSDREMRTRISTMSSRLAKDRLLIRYMKRRDREKRYVSATWFNDDGSLKEQYREVMREFDPID